MQLAAKVAKVALRTELTNPAVLAALRESPQPVLEAAFARAHGAIEAAFTAHYEEQGWMVGRCSDGFLTRCRASEGGGAPRGFMCVHGGTTATVVVVLDGHRVVSANVGDSTALLCGLGADRVRLRPAREWVPLPPVPADGGGAGSASPFGSSGGPSHQPPQREAFPLGGAAAAGAWGDSSSGGLASQFASSCSVSGGTPSGGLSSASGGAGHGRPLPPSPPGGGLRPLDRDFPVLPVPPQSLAAYVEVSADHSPESLDEYRRVHAFRPAAHAPAAHHGNHGHALPQPELQFVYDTLTASKQSCPPIFALDPRTGVPAKTERGSYYKNVRCEWATLVSTPPHAPFQDALAFTRSLGDFHLQSWGVSHTPEVAWLDLCDGCEEEEGAAVRNVDDSDDDDVLRPQLLTPLVPHPVALVVSSDGIWVSCARTRARRPHLLRQHHCCCACGWPPSTHGLRRAPCPRLPPHAPFSSAGQLALPRRRQLRAHARHAGGRHPQQLGPGRGRDAHGRQPQARAGQLWRQRRQHDGDGSLLLPLPRGATTGVSAFFIGGRLGV